MRIDNEVDERLALSRDKEEGLKLASEGNIIATAKIKGMD